LGSNDYLNPNDTILPGPSGKPFSVSQMIGTPNGKPPSSTGEVETKVAAMSDDAAGIFRKLAQHPNKDVREIACRALSWQASGIGSLALPSKIEALYPMAFERLALYLQALAGGYPSDHQHKDWVFVTGESVPVTRSHSVDLSSRIGYRASFSLIAAQARWRYARDLFRGQEVGPWLRVHTEPRSLEDWNEAGWDEVYHQCARLLRYRPRLLGLAATAWFYDPQLAGISAHLCYCRERLLERGAVIMRVGTSDFDIASATARSPTRRKLYESGRYVPVAYTLLWPRERLLRWDDGGSLNSKWRRASGHPC
jgi:hypothetical protein